MKTVLITGASRGIGKATAKRFAEAGYSVVVNYNKSEALAEELCREIQALGGKALAFGADIADDEQVKKMVKEAVACFGTIDVLVNNAGVALPQGLFTDFADTDARCVFDTNVFGMMNCTRAIVPHFVSKKSGKIVNVSSIWGISGASCEAIYSASKAAVIGFTKAMARELAPSGINVNCVAPGMIDTDMNAHLPIEDREAFAEDVPLGRIGTAAEVADAILFLASEKSDYITGQTLTVDGGLL
ncbi:MAG: glucose 1-dehydrogenase [Clostridia bacterium]|nr:glucose 1-dehydrogenase [Clostridia bacterium]